MKKSKNIYHRLSERQLYGRKLHVLNEIDIISDSCLEDDKADLSNKTKKLFLCFYKLYKLPNRPYKDVQKCLKKLDKHLNDDAKGEELGSKANHFGIIEMLFDVLVCDIFGKMPPVGKETESKAMMKCPEHVLNDAKMVLDICDILGGDYFSFSHLRWNCRILEALFSLVLERAWISNTACKILEVVLLGTDHAPICFKNINGFSDMLTNLDCNLQKYSFFHILSLFLSDSEFLASSNNTLQRHDHWLPSRSSLALKANLKFLLSIPSFLERMCLAGCAPPPSFSISDHSIFSELGLFEPELLAQLEANHSTDLINPFLNMKLNGLKIFVADIFHLVSLLLLSDHRNEVQLRLAECGFFSSIYVPAEKLVWKPTPYSFFFDPNVSSDCSATVYLQIQFLRLVHAIAENHANRYYLLSPQEIATLKEITKSNRLSIPFQLAEFDSSKVHCGDKGLLSMIVDELKLEREKSVIRFWITRAMEAFLRGEAYPVHQLFLIEKNVVEDMIRVLLSYETKHEMVLQGTFDFLSTIMRDNLEAFARCERAIDCTANFIQLVKVIEANLVDSNMFVRCMALTNFNMKQTGPTAPGELRDRDADGTSQRRLLDWYSAPTVLIDLASKFIRLLRLDTLSQENVSCLNTTILILYVAEKNQQLPSYLTSLSQQQDGDFLLTNLKTLLQFWRTHYRLPSKKLDRVNLEQSTGVTFDQWCSFVDLLLNPEPFSASTIRYHLPQKSSSSLTWRQRPV